jgi:hypothetical protein
MKCQTMDQVFILHYYKELKSSKVQEMEGHLAQCEKCRGSWKGIQATLSLAGKDSYGTLPEKMAESFSQGVRKRIETRRKKGPWVFLPSLRPAPVFSMAVLIGFVFLAALFWLGEGLKNEVAEIPFQQEIELVQQLDFFSNVDLLEEMDLLTEWESEIGEREEG